MTSLYRKDFHAWCLEQTSALLSEKIDVLDFKNLAEEIKDVGDSEEDNLENRMIVLFEHLLKCIYQPDKRTGSWDGSIREQRKRIKKRLKKSPSLKPLLKEIAEDAYEISIIRAAEEMGIPEKNLPEKMPFTVEDALREDWMPQQEK